MAPEPVCGICGSTEFDRGWFQAFGGVMYAPHKRLLRAVLSGNALQVAARVCMNCGRVESYLTEDGLKELRRLRGTGGK